MIHRDCAAMGLDRQQVTRSQRILWWLMVVVVMGVLLCWGRESYAATSTGSARVSPIPQSHQFFEFCPGVATHC